MTTKTSSPAAQIEKAYAKLAPKEYGSVKFTDLRYAVALTTKQFNTAIAEMAQRSNVYIRAESDQKTLTVSDHIDAIILGGTPRHNILITK